MARNIRWTTGYSAHQLANIQSRFDLRFPPDLIELYSQRRPVGTYDWLTDIAEIKRKLTWPLEGLLFDIENNVLWLDAWGERPGDKAARAEIVTAAVAKAPKLIPICGHRYLPETPALAGNPVLSVYQSDIIVYGTNLSDYIDHEFGPGNGPRLHHGPVRKIPFWSQFID